MIWSTTFRSCTSCASSPLDADKILLLTQSVQPFLILLSSGRTAYVMVGDISRTGACVVRRGSLEVVANEAVLLDVSDDEKHLSISLPARVQRVNTRSYNTLVRLLFSQRPLLLGTMLDQYFDKTLMARGSVEG